MIENILIIDTETTGLEPSKGAKTIEVAAVLFNLKNKVVLQNYSTLLPCETNPVEHINHISVDATNCNFSLCLLDSILINMAANAQACVAHNAVFDKKFLSLLGCGQHLLNKKWICTKANFTWPVPLSRLRLEDICNGMKVPYVQAHRALNDCLLLAQCFGKIEDLQHRFNF